MGNGLDLEFRGRELIKEPQRVSISQFVPDAVFPFLSFSHVWSGVQVEKTHVSHWRVFISENLNQKRERASGSCEQGSQVPCSHLVPQLFRVRTLLETIPNATKNRFLEYF